MAIVLVLVLHGAIVVSKASPRLGDELHGADAYMRLVLVTQLYESGAWFDHTIDRSNAPYGMESHWTRPMDVLLLAGGWMLSAWFGFQKGLMWWAVFVSPVLHLATVVALIWATRPLFDRLRHHLLILTFLAQAPLWHMAIVGRADHHVLIILAFVVAIGLNLRLVTRPFDRRLAAAAGAALGFGLWLTTEGLLLLAGSFAALTAIWLLRGGDLSRRCLWHALGLSAMIALAIVVERPPQAYLVDQYGRISIAHLSVGLLASGFWLLVCLLERRGLGESPVSHRLAVTALGALVAGGLQFLLYPKFFGGSEIAMDSQLGPAFYDTVAELKPLLPTDLHTLGRFLFYLGPAFVTVPFLIWLLVRERQAPIWYAWLYMAACVGVFVPLALAMIRFAIFADVLLAIVLAELLARLMLYVDRIDTVALRAPVRLGVMAGVLIGPLVLGAAILKPAEARTVGHSCPLAQVVERLNDPGDLGGVPRTILAHYNYGPELLYRTAHSVVASPYPYYRNGAGLLDGDRIFGAAEDAASRRLIERRGINLVMFCPKGPAHVQATMRGGDTFASRLLDGRVPPWLRRIDRPASGERGFLLFEVVR